MYTNVDTLVISDGVKYNSYAFSRAAIKNVRIESPEIPNGLFYASKIKSIILGENVAKIGSSAFYNVKDCENITILGNTIPTWAFGSSSYSASILFTSQLLAKVQLNVPCGMKTIIESDHDKWATFLNVKEYFPYQFNAVANYNERGDVFIETDPKCDVEAVIKAEANSGYRFEHWCDGSTENPRSVAVDDDITLTAFFAPVYTPTSLDEQETLNIYAENGRIFGTENAQIYDLVGRNVTHENGNLHGIFVVKQNAQTQKIVVK